MEDHNSVSLVGCLVRDAEIRHVTESASVAVFDLAYSTRDKKGGEWQDVTHYVQVQQWNPGGLAEYLKKGQQIAVHGQLRFEKWEKDGETKHKHFIRSMHTQLVGKKEQ